MWARVAVKRCKRHMERSSGGEAVVKVLDARAGVEAVVLDARAARLAWFV